MSIQQVRARTFTRVMLAAALLGALFAAPATVLAACSVQTQASATGADVIVTASATCSGSPQIRVTIDGTVIATVPGSQVTVRWPASGPAGPRTIVVEATELTDTNWSNPARATLSLVVTPPAESAPPAGQGGAPGGSEITSLPSRVVEVGPATQGDEDEGPCFAQEDAHEEVHLRGLASLSTLESLRAYEAALDQQYNAQREQEYWNASVDVASLAAGWPIGKGVQDAILGQAKESLKEKLIKASFKSVNKALLKDPSLHGVLDQLDNPPTELSGALYDQFKEGTKYGLNQLFKGAGDTVMGFLDVAVLGKKVYAGMSRLEAVRAMLRDVQEKILAAEEQRLAEMEHLDHAVNAVALCLEGVSHADNWRWQEVRGYLGRDESTSAPPRQASGPTAAEGYFAFILDGIGVVLATEREVAETPGCQWNGGGPRPCPGAPPATVVGRLGGPYDNSTDGIADLKTKLDCFRGYWGDFIKVGDKNVWLQNNVTVAACKTVTQL